MPTDTDQSIAGHSLGPLPSGRAHHVPLPSDAGVPILRLISEQFSVPFDQLVRFLGCTESEALPRVQELYDCACIEIGRFEIDRPPWIWLRTRGARLSGTGFGCGRRPIVAQLGHRRAVNELRLQLADRAPHGRWICERRVYREGARSELRPDAVFEIDGERHALEVELSCKALPKLRQVIAQHSTRFDAVIYFCGPDTEKLLAGLLATGEFPKLVVRDLELGAVAARARSPRARAASPGSLEEGRRRLNAAMAEIVAESGYRASRLEDLCRRAGISTGSFYRYFDDKEDCFHAVAGVAPVADESAEVIASLASLLDGRRRPPQVPFSSLHPGRSNWSREFVVSNQRARILAAVADVLVEAGYAEISISKVCAHARLSRRTFYDLFDSLDDSILAAAAAAVPSKGCDRRRSAEAGAPASKSAERQPGSRWCARPPRAAIVARLAAADPWLPSALRLLAEQGAIPVDQLERFLQPLPETPAFPAQVLAEAGLVHQRRFLAGEPAWIWLRGSAVRLAPGRLRQYEPKLGGLARLRAINEIRLQLDSPEAGLAWTGWRQLGRELHGAGFPRKPVAVVEVGDERHGIYLEMSHRGREPIARIVDHAAATYDAVVFFCTSIARRRLEQVSAEHRWSKLVIRDLPGGDPRGRQWRPVE